MVSVLRGNWLGSKLGGRVAAGGVGVVGGQDAGGGGEDGEALAFVGLCYPDEYVVGSVGMMVFEGARGGVEILPQHPAQESAMGRSVRQAACRRGASSAVERSRQWASSVVPRPGLVAAAIARARSSASSQAQAATTGDQQSRRVPAGHSERAPQGSYSHTCPIAPRECRVAWRMSGLVEVQSAGPCAASRVGIDDGGGLAGAGWARIRTACSGSALTQRPRESPR